MTHLQLAPMASQSGQTLLIVAGPNSALAANHTPEQDEVNHEAFESDSLALRKWHTASAVLNALSGLALFIVTVIFIDKLTLNPITITDVSGVVSTIGHYPVVASVIIADFVAATFQLLSQMHRFFKPSLHKGFNTVRWMELAVTSTLFTMVLAQLANIADFWVLYFVGLVTCASQFLSYGLERANRKVSALHHCEQQSPNGVRKHADLHDAAYWVIEMALFVATWIAILLNLISYALIYTLPWYNWAIVFGGFFFLVVMLSWQGLRFLPLSETYTGVFSLPKYNFNYELGYIILSLVNNMYISWVLFASVLIVGLTV